MFFDEAVEGGGCPLSTVENRQLVRSDRILWQCQHSDGSQHYFFFRGPASKSSCDVKWRESSRVLVARSTPLTPVTMGRVNGGPEKCSIRWNNTARGTNVVAVRKSWRHCCVAHSSRGPTPCFVRLDIVGSPRHKIGYNFVRMSNDSRATQLPFHRPHRHIRGRGGSPFLF